MSRREDFLAAVRLVLVKDVGMTAADALRVMQVACALPDEVVPPVVAHDVAQLCRYAVGDAEPPAWLAEHLENEKAEQADDQVPRRRVSMPSGFNQTTWWMNVVQLHYRHDEFALDELPEGIKLLNAGQGEAWLAQQQLDDLVEWARGIAGYDEADPFEVDQEDEP